MEDNMKKNFYEIQVKSEIQPPLDSNFNFVATHGQLTSNSRATANLKPFAEISTLSQSDSYPTLFAIPLWVRYLKKEVQGFLQTLENSQGLSSNHSIIPKIDKKPSLSANLIEKRYFLLR